MRESILYGRGDGLPWRLLRARHIVPAAVTATGGTARRRPARGPRDGNACATIGLAGSVRKKNQFRQILLREPVDTRRSHQSRKSPALQGQTTYSSRAADIFASRGSLRNGLAAGPAALRGSVFARIEMRFNAMQIYRGATRRSLRVSLRRAKRASVSHWQACGPRSVFSR
ncbi:hypothetical protein PUN28_013057 [Cardiocondyla obscurior]|uniref:Uncharacterized protein n=1 Tax=Cardiocondyla obscurior TaxID=286306 RepID=A0AAW2F6S0_9HYME